MSIGSIAKGALGAASGTIGLGTALGVGAAGLDFFSAKSLQNDAQSFNKGMYQKRYQYTMADMKKAGLNPILAAGMGLGGGGSPTSGIASAGTPGTNAISSALRVAQLNLTRAQTEKTQSETGLNLQQNTMRDWREQLGAWLGQMGRDTGATAQELRKKARETVRKQYKPAGTPAGPIKKMSTGKGKNKKTYILINGKWTLQRRK